MFSNVVIPVSFDKSRNTDAAVTAAMALADKGARITFLHVAEDIPAYAASHIPEDVLAVSRQAAQAELEKIAAGVPGSEAVNTHGHAGRTIVDWATDNDVDLIVVASHKPGLQNYLLGSTADRIVRHAPCAVLVLR